MSLLDRLKAIFQKPASVDEAFAEQLAIEPPGPEAGDYSPFAHMRYCFVPAAVITNSLENLMLVGTECVHGDETYNHLSNLKRNTRYEAGVLAPIGEDGELSNYYTLSDIGRLDFAINDYLNFLIEFRMIFEREGSDKEKTAMIEQLGEKIGSGGHIYAFFIDQHGGIREMLARCKQAEAGGPAAHAFEPDQYLNKATHRGREAAYAQSIGDYNRAWGLYQDQKSLQYQHANQAGLSAQELIALDADVHRNMAELLRKENRSNDALAHIMYWVAAHRHKPTKVNQQKLQVFFNCCKFKNTKLDEAVAFVASAGVPADFGEMLAKVRKWLNRES